MPGLYDYLIYIYSFNFLLFGGRARDQKDNTSPVWLQFRAAIYSPGLFSWRVRSYSCRVADDVTPLPAIPWFVLGLACC